MILRFCLSIASAALITYASQTSVLDPDLYVSVHDSIILNRYEMEIISEYIDNATELTGKEIDSILEENNLRIAERSVTYAPDSAFKIFVIVMEGCGAYCNSQWYSWIHYNLKENEKHDKATFSSIRNIYKLPDSKYLVLDENSGRPASVLSIACYDGRVISFSRGSMEEHKGFGFCQESAVEIEPVLEYEEATATLRFHYGNNYLYSMGQDIDSIYKGYLRYEKGAFVLKSEKLSVIDKRRPEEDH